MRLNVFVASATGMSRRAADTAIQAGRVTVNGTVALLGQQITPSDTVALDSDAIIPAVKSITIILNKPVGYVCSRDGQGSKTVYDILPPELHQLKPVGRLDKDSSGLLLMTNDGQLANELTHPRYQKVKKYDVALHKALTKHDKQQIEQGVLLTDGISKMKLRGSDKQWIVTMTEGRNRQIRRTFATLGYRVASLHRTQFGPHAIGSLNLAEYSRLW